MRFLRFSSLASLALAFAACSSSTNSSLDNGTFTAPASVTQGQTFQASFTPNTPSLYPHVEVLPVSTAYITVVPGGFKASTSLTGNPALYAIANGQVLGYVTVEITGTSK